MIYVGIDVAKDKHDCLITDSEGKILLSSFIIPNNRLGYDELYSKIMYCSKNDKKVKVGLEATGHYSDNLIEFIADKGLPLFVINPLHTNLYRKSLSLRKTKTDIVDTHSIVTMLRTEILKPYSSVSYHIRELKSLSRYRLSLVKDCSRLKVSLARLVVILFPELEKLVPSLHMKSVYALLKEFPSAQLIANSHLTRLTNLLHEASRGRYGREKAIEIRESARLSIGSSNTAKCLELKQTIYLIHTLQEQILEVEAQINPIVDSLESPIMTIPGISYRMAAIILAEIGDFMDFETPEKILAYAGMEPSIYQSGQMNSNHGRMVKRGSKYLRYALFNATKYVCNWNPTFSDYLLKKRKEGKHYNVAISHAAKKLVRVMYYLVKTNQPFQKAI